MKTSYKIGIAFVLSMTLVACGGGHHGERRAHAAAAAAANPSSVAVKPPAAPRAPRELESQLWDLDMKLKQDGLYNLERQTIIGWFNDVRGYSQAQRARIRANAFAVRALGTEMKAWGTKENDEATRERGRWFEVAANRVVQKMGRLDRQEVAFDNLTKALKK